MQISAYSGKARIFRHNRWSEWMNRDVAAKLERQYLWGNKMPRKGIVPTAVAKELN